MSEITQDDVKESVLNLAKEREQRRAIQAQCLDGRKEIRKTLVPFCEQCLLDDYRQALLDVEAGRSKDRTYRVPKLKWKEYAGKELFDFHGEGESRKPDGNRIEVVKTSEWKCKRRNHGVSIASEPTYVLR